VAKFYPSFLEEFPSPEKLSVADPKRLQRLGRQLGLKKRMLWLVRAAKTICQKHGGKVPREFDELIKLPGVGPYTASAVLCFGFKRDCAIIDVNVVRVLSRVIGLRCCRKNNGDFKEISKKLVPKSMGVTYNEALLDFAAMICKKRPICNKCPLSHLCVYHQKSIAKK
jgi:A/G-specific adenine glycosylase